MVKGLRPYDSSVKYYVYIVIYLCEDLQYLLSIAHAKVLFLGLEIIHLACGSSSPPFISFSPKCESISYYQMAATLYSIM